MKNWNDMNHIVLVSLLFISSCTTLNSAYKFGYYYNDVQNKYILLTENPENFGRSRLNSLLELCPSLKGFVQYHGYPDMTYEFVIENKAGIKLYYMDSSEVYIFQDLKDNFYPLSRYLKDHRKVSESLLLCCLL